MRLCGRNLLGNLGLTIGGTLKRGGICIIIRSADRNLHTLIAFLAEMHSCPLIMEKGLFFILPNSAKYVFFYLHKMMNLRTFLPNKRRCTSSYDMSCRSYARLGFLTLGLVKYCIPLSYSGQKDTNVYLIHANPASQIPALLIWHVANQS